MPAARTPWTVGQVSLFWGLLAVFTVLAVGSLRWVDSVAVVLLIAAIELAILALAAIEFKRLGDR